MKRFLALLLGLMTVFAAAALAEGGDEFVEVTVNLTYRYDMTESMLEIINDFRTGEIWYWNSDDTTKTELPAGSREPLTYDYGLEKVAMQRAAECAVFYDHTRPNKLQCFSIYPSSATNFGENIAAGYASVQEVFDGWKEENEPYKYQGHRRNMLSGDYTHIGIGCVYADGTYFWCQAFGTPATGESKSTLSGPAKIETSLTWIREDANGKYHFTNLSADPASLKIPEGESMELPAVSGKSGGWGTTAVLVESAPWTTEDTELLSISGGKATALKGGKGKITVDLGNTLEVDVVCVCAEHTWDEGVVTTEPTCTETGILTKTCTVCGETMEEDIEALGHNWGEAEYTWNEDHSKVTAHRTCLRDNEHQETETVDASSEVTTEPTCEEKGETTYTGAAFANAAFTAQTEKEDIEPLGHDWGEAEYVWNEDDTKVTASRICKNDGAHVETETVDVTAKVTKEAKCEVKGETTYTGAAFTNTAFTVQTKTLADIPAKGHTPVKTEQVDPTCTETGTEAFWACSACEKLFSDEGAENEISAPVVIAALGHSWGEAEYTWNEDHSKVTALRTCTRDAAHQETETVSADAKVTKAATCEAKGETTYTGAAFANTAFTAQTVKEDIEPLGHDWGEAEYVWNEDNTKVTASRICKHDGAHVETETVNVTAKVTREAKCEVKGETTYTGAAFTNTAFTVQTKTLEDIPALEHKEVIDAAVAATCTEAGKTEGKHCSVCGKVLVAQEVIPALGHDWGQGKVTKEPTATEEGIRTYTCAVCGETKEEAIPRKNTGWKETEAGWVYMKEDGTKATDWLEIDGTYYCFDENGVMRTGWYEENGFTYYLGTDGKMATGDVEVDGTVYHFNEGGACTGEAAEDPGTPEPGTPEPANPEARGWVYAATGWTYVKDDGTRATGWLNDGGTWYYMNDSGYMLTGWVGVNGTWYYMQPSGAMATGWVNDGGTWYYMKSSGAMLTGWLSDGGTWYYMRPSGAMATGWVYDGNAWYCMKPSGAMATGWMLDRGTWYYFRSSGAMVTGWQKIGGTWYYFHESGAMATGWYEEKDAWGNTTAWYWFDNSGAMATGWKEINGQWEMFADSGAWLYTYQGE